jgi:hypothetical protein
MSHSEIDLIDELRFHADLLVKAADEVEELRKQILRLHSQILRNEMEEIHAREQRARKSLRV